MGGLEGLLLKTKVIKGKYEAYFEFQRDSNIRGRGMDIFWKNTIIKCHVIAEHFFPLLVKLINNSKAKDKGNHAQ